MHLFRETKQRFQTAKRDTESRLDRDLRNSDMLELLLDQFEIEEIESESEDMLELLFEIEEIKSESETSETKQ